MNNAETLAANWRNLPDRDHAFAQSLLNQLAARGALTARQWDWIDKLAQRAQRPAAPTTVELRGLQGMLARALETLQRPRIVLSGLQVKARKTGLAYVTTDRGNRYWGAIKDGVFHPARELPGDVAPIVEKLRELDAAPIEAAQRYARETGCCCFCARTLTDARSTKVGYGPTCADNYGLPWGE